MQVSELVCKREREVKRLFVYCMTRSFLVAELTLAEFKILFKISFFLCCEEQALPASSCGGSAAVSNKGRNLPPLKALEVHLVCWLVPRHLVREILAFHSCKRLKYHHFQNTSSWLMNKMSTHPSAAVGKKMQAMG